MAKPPAKKPGLVRRFLDAIGFGTAGKRGDYPGIMTDVFDFEEDFARKRGSYISRVEAADPSGGLAGIEKQAHLQSNLKFLINIKLHNALKEDLDKETAAGVMAIAGEIKDLVDQFYLHGKIGDKKKARAMIGLARKYFDKLVAAAEATNPPRKSKTSFMFYISTIGALLAAMEEELKRSTARLAA